MAAISLTTDFGSKDWFVGTLKAVILGINPSVQLVDLTHEIPPGDAFAGALALKAAYDYFPLGTVHLAVVDPGVGSPRTPLALETESFRFVGPDNGLLSLAAPKEKIVRAVRLENPAYFRPSVSRTFHGRDLFAPVAAHLSNGVPLEELGPPLTDWVEFKIPEPNRTPSGISGEILYIDRFGNGLTNIREADLAGLDCPLLTLAKSDITLPLKTFYGAVPAGDALSLVASSGFVELAVNCGNAAERFGFTVGDPVLAHDSETHA